MGFFSFFLWVCVFLWVMVCAEGEGEIFGRELRF